MGGVLLVAAAVGLLWWSPWESPEPVYDGKSVSAWLNDLDSKTGRLSTSATNALRHLGSNAIPRLLKEASIRSFPTKEIANDLLKKQRIIRFHFAPNPDHQAIAQQGFRSLGTMGIQAVAQGLTNSDRWIRYGCVGQWELCKDYPDILFEPLFHCLQDPVPSVRGRAANALGMLHHKPEQVVPVLIAMLSDSDDDVRGLAAIGLGLYGDKAKSAFPTLLKMFNAPDKATKTWVVYALKSIDPASAAKAGVKAPSP
jgi:hypothetical protein